MASSFLVCNEESVEISRTIKFKPKTWTVANEYYITTDPFTFSNLNASIKIDIGNYHNGQNYVSLFVRLLPQSQADESELTPKDTRKITTTIEYGSRSKSFTDIASRYGRIQSNNSVHSLGFGYPYLDTTEYIKKHPIIRVTLKMNCKDKPRENQSVAAQSFKQRHMQLYELSKLNGDITIIVMNKDIDNNEHIQCPPPHKKRKLNNNNASNASNANNTNNSNDHQNSLDNEENTMKVSGIILQSASPVFKSILSTNMIEKQEKKIIVYAKDVKCVDDMIYFMCTNELRGNVNAINVFKLANFYQMDVLKCKCTNKMAKEINIYNFVEITNLFDMYGIKDGYDKLIEFAKENVEQLKKVDNFDQLSHAFKMTVLEY